MAVRVPTHLVENDPTVLAPMAGLEYIADSAPGWRRRRRGRGFTYLDQDAKTITGRSRERIESLAIPPAWSEVWICPSSIGYLQASGHDDAGRKQYRYHDGYRRLADQRKFARLTYFGRAVVEIRQAVARALEQPLGTPEHAVAAAVRLIDAEMLRVGNERSAAHGHHGATTLTVDHVVDDGSRSGLGLEYVGKSGQVRSVVIDDDELANTLIDLADGADGELFWFEEGGTRRRADSSDLNAFIRRHGGAPFSARDFRTWGGSTVAMAARGNGAGPIEAADRAAGELGNTRAVARSAYIHPRVLDATDEQVAAAWSRSRSSRWRDRAESALSKLISAPDR